MGAEIGATTSVFLYNDHMRDYLVVTNRADAANAADDNLSLLTANKGAKYDQVIELDLSTLEPYANEPFAPDLGNPISRLGEAAKKNNWPLDKFDWKLYKQPLR